MEHKRSHQPDLVEKIQMDIWAANPQMSAKKREREVEKELEKVLGKEVFQLIKWTTGGFY